MSHVFLTGGTGYTGRRLISALVKGGHQVRALVRAGSESELPPGCTPILGNSLNADSYTQQVPPGDTVVQLVGTPKPNPRKGKLFREVDFKSGMAAATQAGVQHLVYVSVAHPAPMMEAYIQQRVEVEESIRSNGLNATILRPWYLLAPGHLWPYLILPGYWIAGLIPSKREAAQRLGLVKLNQMIGALVAAVENPAQGIKIVGVPEIRQYR